ncbi:MAG: hypothetical protein AAFQ51_04530 [Pseudomonadota bacterium]
MAPADAQTLELEARALVDSRFDTQTADRDQVEFAGTLQLSAEQAVGEVDLSLIAQVYVTEEEQTVYLPEARAKFSIDPVSFLVGVDIESWSRVEAVERLSLLNQTDLERDLSGETKLGEPMVRATVLGDVGLLGLYYLPLHQERPFGPDLSPQPKAVYETEAEEFAPSFVLRFSTAIDDLDLEAIAFHGTDREPSLRPGASGPEALYPVVTQLGLGAQYLMGATFLRGEGVHVVGRPDARGRTRTDQLYTVEVEHETYDPVGLGFDVAGILSYAGSSLGEDSANDNQNDGYAGLRFTWNDVGSTEISVLAGHDFDFGSTTLTVEFERRLNDRLLLSIEAFEVFDVGRDPALSPLENAGGVRLELTTYF